MACFFVSSLTVFLGYCYVEKRLPALKQIFYFSSLCIFSVLSYLNFVPGLFYLRAGYQGISIKFLCNTLFSKQVLFCKPPFASKGSFNQYVFSRNNKVFIHRTAFQLERLVNSWAFDESLYI